MGPHHDDPIPEMSIGTSKECRSHTGSVNSLGEPQSSGKGWGSPTVMDYVFTGGYMNWHGLVGHPQLLLPLGIVFVILGFVCLDISKDNLTVKKAGVILILAGIGLGLAWWRFLHPHH